VRAPFQSRASGDLRGQRIAARAWKELGVVGQSEIAAGSATVARSLRIVERPARSGFFHPAGRREILALLRFFGGEFTYGLRSIELTPGGDADRDGRLLLGRLIAPGKIVLYAQREPPWTLAGVLPAADRLRLQRAGAIVHIAGEGVQTIVAWPRDTLRDFMLFDVLLHEVGHHLLQQCTGKRRARIARTKDHEAFADLFAQRCRRAFESRGAPLS
jgi:hypothetical protein